MFFERKQRDMIPICLFTDKSFSHEREPKKTQAVPRLNPDTMADALNMSNYLTNK